MAAQILSGHILYLVKKQFYVYNSDGKLISTIDFKALKEYTYYDMGNLSKYTEKSFVLDGNVIKSRTVDFSIVYEYEDGKLVRTNYISSDGSARTVSTEYPEKENRLVRFEAGGKTVTSRSKTDGFGRKMFDELQLGTGFVSRQFSYYGGQVTEEHSENEKLKSSPTTALVSQIVYTDGRTISYEYDAEERITKITDTENGVTEYTYDALGQLLTETKNGTAVNTMTYDEYGNILTKNDIVYTYGNGVWRDLLTGYCGKTITYDAQGNPLMYLGESLSWSKGRQLKAFGNNSYTYNASGVRTSKTVGLTKHNYTLDGTKILKEAWGNNTIIPLYSNETDICGIIYNSEPFYFIKNLQGDIISITNKNGTSVAGYSYDAWGVCTIVSDLSNCNIAEVNPFRYRGYYYDSETKLYYLQSRYYDPAVGRFINADAIEIIDFAKDNPILTNLYTYCGNSVVDSSDVYGFFSLDDVWNILLDLLEKAKNSIFEYLRSLFYIENGVVNISVGLMSFAIDTGIACIIGWFLSNATKMVLEFLKQCFRSYDMAYNIISGLLHFVSEGAGKWILRLLISSILVALGKKPQVVDTLVSDYIQNLIASKNNVLSKCLSLASACSSIGGILAFILDLCDGTWDDYLRITVSRRV